MNTVEHISRNVFNCVHYYLASINIENTPSNIRNTIYAIKFKVIIISLLREYKFKMSYYSMFNVLIN